MRPACIPLDRALLIRVRRHGSAIHKKTEYDYDMWADSRGIERELSKLVFSSAVFDSLLIQSASLSEE